jgi:hypothetical protein
MWNFCGAYKTRDLKTADNKEKMLFLAHFSLIFRKVAVFGIRGLKFSRNVTFVIIYLMKVK